MLHVINFSCNPYFLLKYAYLIVMCPTRLGTKLLPLSFSLFVGLRRGGTNRYVSDTSCLNQPPSMQNQPPSFMPPPGGPAQVPPNPSLPSAPAPTGPQFFTPASQAPGAPMYGSQPQMQQPPPPTKPPAAYDSSVPRGWNDPPPLSGSRKVRLNLLLL